MNIAGDERSLCHNNVATLFVDGGGTLWVGTAGGLARYNEARDDFDRIDLLRDNDAEPRITSISQSPDSSIFVGMSGYGLYRIADGKTAFPVQTFSKGCGTGFYPGVLVDKQGRLWNIGFDEHVYSYSSATDTGIGLRKADIPRLFSHFYQSAITLVAGKEGTGIGLNLCKMIVEMHHGTIEAHNR